MTNKKISIAFCFDNNMWTHAGVAITSLLYHGRGVCAYDIYCVVPSDFGGSKRRELTSVVANMDPNSKISFLNANNDFDDSVTHQYTVGIYYRFMLAKMLPKIKRIIYADVDVAFNDCLDELYNCDIGDNVIAGVRDASQGRAWPSQKNGYINSGVLVMDLDKIRRLGLYEKWIELSKCDQFMYPDQDILNKTCDGRILYLPLKFNYMPGAGNWLQPAVAQGIYSESEFMDATKNPVIIHYILRQPWLGRANLCGDVWWRYCAMTPFYAAFLARIRQMPDVVVKYVKVLNCINVMKIKMRQNDIKCYLFGLIPICRIKRAND